MASSAARVKFRLALDPALKVVNIVEYLLIGIKSGDLLTDAVEQGERLALGANQDLRKGRHHERVRCVDRRRHRLVQPVIQRIAYDANDLQPSRDSICG
jgi:hypothetical protein